MSHVPFHILTDHGDSQHFIPYRIKVELKSSLFRSNLFKRLHLRFLSEFILGIKCWWVSIRHRGQAPFVTIGSGHGFVFAFCQYLARPIITPRTHVMFDLLLEKKRHGLAGFFDSLKMHVFNKAVDCAVVWGQADVTAFSNEYKIPSDKFVFTPFHITLEAYRFDIGDDRYIFAGGNGQRDYETLINAVKTLDYPVLIASTLPGLPELTTGYPHITVKGVTHEEFRQKMARCSVFVQCHASGFLRTAGHQTILNAMWMGKPVILADKESAVGYIEDSQDGLVVEIGDVEGLRNKICQILDTPSLALRLGKAARAKIDTPKYRTLNCMQTIYNLALKIELAKNGQDTSENLINLY